MGLCFTASLPHLATSTCRIQIRALQPHLSWKLERLSLQLRDQVLGPRKGFDKAICVCVIAHAIVCLHSDGHEYHVSGTTSGTWKNPASNTRSIQGAPAARLFLSDLGHLLAPQRVQTASQEQREKAIQVQGVVPLPVAQVCPP